MNRPMTAVILFICAIHIGETVYSVSMRVYALLTNQLPPFHG
jgi:hypothetical protein